MRQRRKMQITAMLPHHLPGQTQPDARALRLGGIERNEHMVLGIWGNASAVVHYLNPDQMFGVGIFVGTQENAAFRNLAAGFHGVFEQV